MGHLIFHVKHEENYPWIFFFKISNDYTAGGSLFYVDNDPCHNYTGIIILLYTGPFLLTSNGRSRKQKNILFHKCSGIVDRFIDI